MLTTYHRDHRRHLPRAEQDHPRRIPRSLARPHQIAGFAESRTSAMPASSTRTSFPRSEPSFSKLKPAQISEAYAKALAGRRDDKPGGLSPRTVGHMHRVLKQALGQAVQLGAIEPQPGRRRRSSEDRMEARADLRPAADGRRDRSLSRTAALRSCPAGRSVRPATRRNLRPRWKNVDLAGAQISVVESLEQTKAGPALQVAQERQGPHRGSVRDRG